MEHDGDPAGEALARGLGAVLLDYDGTLTPIVGHPDDAVLDPPMRARVRALAERCPVAIVSGRDREQVEALVGLDGLVYLGSHGHDIAGPGIAHRVGEQCVPALDAAEAELRAGLAEVPGAIVERKRFSLATHHRLVAEERRDEVRRAVEAAAARHPELRLGAGHRVQELAPDLDWGKGPAVLWLLERWGVPPDRAVVYVGDDVTDESAFRALAGRGVTVLVASEPRETAARHRVADPEAVGRLLDALIAGGDAPARG